MLIIKNDSDNPFFNHAAEEYMLNYEEEALYAALEDYDINNFMNNITKNNLIQCIFGN